jgi:hypothetical protein
MIILPQDFNIIFGDLSLSRMIPVIRAYLQYNQLLMLRLECEYAPETHSFTALLDCINFYSQNHKFTRRGILYAELGANIHVWYPNLIKSYISIISCNKEKNSKILIESNWNPAFYLYHGFNPVDCSTLVKEFSLNRKITIKPVNGLT